MLGSYEGIKLGCIDGNLISTILGGGYGIILGLYVWTNLVSLDVSFDGFHDVKFGGFLLRVSLW